MHDATKHMVVLVTEANVGANLSVVHINESLYVEGSIVHHNKTVTSDTTIVQIFKKKHCRLTRNYISHQNIFNKTSHKQITQITTCCLVHGLGKKFLFVHDLISMVAY